jgi:hypothetical protein
MNIIEFLKARIAEDELEASVCLASPEHTTRRWVRVLAECAAKLFIITMHETYAKVAAERTGLDAFGAECGREETADVLRPLARVYADHPDYRQDWAA